MPSGPVISIVTTVYDAKDYLPATVKSILGQTFRDFELLLVEDGSPNGCGELCDELAKTDPRIRVFHKPNGGPASAANVGLDNARGAYIGFVDSDDLIEPDMYERLYAAIQATGARIAACTGDAIDEAGEPIPDRPVAIRRHGVMDARDLLLETFQTGSFYGPLSWNKLFDIRTFRDKGVRYDESMFFGDDASVLHLVFEGERAVCLPDVLYHYRARRGQMTAAAFPPRKLDDLRMYRDWLDYYARDGKDGELYRWAVSWYARVFYTFVCLAGDAGVLGDLRAGFRAHLPALRRLWPDIARCPYLSMGQKLRAALVCADPGFAYALAHGWGRAAQRFHRP